MKLLLFFNLLNFSEIISNSETKGSCIKEEATPQEDFTYLNLLFRCRIESLKTPKHLLESFCYDLANLIAFVEDDYKNVIHDIILITSRPSELLNGCTLSEYNYSVRALNIITKVAIHDKLISLDAAKTLDFVTEPDTNSDGAFKSNFGDRIIQVALDLMDQTPKLTSKSADFNLKVFLDEMEIVCCDLFAGFRSETNFRDFVAQRRNSFEVFLRQLVSFKDSINKSKFFNSDMEAMEAILADLLILSMDLVFYIISAYSTDTTTASLDLHCWTIYILWILNNVENNAIGQSKNNDALFLKSNVTPGQESYSRLDDNNPNLCIKIINRYHSELEMILNEADFPSASYDSVCEKMNDIFNSFSANFSRFLSLAAVKEFYELYFDYKNKIEVKWRNTSIIYRIFDRVKRFIVYTSKLAYNWLMTKILRR